jgi:cation diffusion facilitator family transporter
MAAPEHGSSEVPAKNEEAHGDHGGGLRVVIVALIVNTLIAVFKFIAAAISGSTAMLAEAVHSLADTANQIFLLIGMRRSTRPPDYLHPFGYGTETYFWSFIVAGSIFTIGAIVSMWEGLEKIWHILHKTYHPHGDIRWAIVVLSVSIVLELWSLRAAVSEFRHITRGRSLLKTIQDARDPTVITVLFEDVAAIFGLVIALVGILLAHYLHQPIFDALASVFVGLSLGVVAMFLGRESMSLLVGEAVPEEEHKRMVDVTAAFPGVLEVIHIRTLHIAPREVLGAFKLRFARDLSMDQLEVKINELESRLREVFPHLRRIYIEPGFDESKGRDKAHL